MPHTPDKEFDNLFKHKLIDAALEPPAHLWTNIATQLGPKAKPKLPIFWMAAASVALVIAALLMWQQKEPLYLRGHLATANSLPKPVDRPIIDEDTAFKQLVKSNNKPLSNANINLTGKKVSTSNMGHVKDTVSLQPNSAMARLPIQTTLETPPHVAPTTTHVLPIELAMANADNYNDENNMEATETNIQPKGIRNIGDLVNYVVDKVDKRENKFIKFNTDDDESAISAINIGFLKLNSKKHK